MGRSLSSLLFTFTSYKIGIVESNQKKCDGANSWPPGKSFLYKRDVLMGGLIQRQLEKFIGRMLP